MKRVIKIVLVVAVLAGAIVGVRYYLTREEPERVTVIRPSRATIEETVAATGSVEASRTVRVTMEPGWRVASVHFREQQHVEKGQLLVKLDETELLGQLDQINANLSLAETNRAATEVTLGRLRRLYDKGYAARQEVENAERQLDLSRAQIADRKAALAQIEARRSRASIVSPISGIVTRQFVEVGGVISGGDVRLSGQPSAQPVAEIAETGSTEFQADVDQADVARLRVGQPATVQIDALPRQVFQSVTREIAAAPMPDPTGRVRYVIRLPLRAADGLLKIGMTGSARFVIARKEQALALPLAVILQQGEQEIVYVLRDGRAIMKRIETGLQGEAMVEIASGLSPEDLVIDQGRAKLKDGRRVELVEAKR